MYIISISDNESDIQPLKLRVPRELVRDIDNLLSQRKPKISRHNWIRVKVCLD